MALNLVPFVWLSVTLISAGALVVEPQCESDDECKSEGPHTFAVDSADTLLQAKTSIEAQFGPLEDFVKTAVSDAENHPIIQNFGKDAGKAIDSAVASTSKGGKNALDWVSEEGKDITFSVGPVNWGIESGLHLKPAFEIGADGRYFTCKASMLGDLREGIKFGVTAEVKAVYTGMGGNMYEFFDGLVKDGASLPGEKDMKEFFTNEVIDIFKCTSSNYDVAGTLTFATGTGWKVGVALGWANEDGYEMYGGGSAGVAPSVNLGGEFYWGVKPDSHKNGKKECRFLLALGPVTLDIVFAIPLRKAVDVLSKPETYRIVSTYGCPHHRWCNAELSWDRAHPHPMISVEHHDPVVWQFTKVGVDKFHIRSLHGCPNSQWCMADLSWDTKSPHPMLSLEFGDPVIWKLERVHGKDTYIIRSQHACPSHKWCNAEISWDGTPLHPMGSLEFHDRVEWKIVK